MKPTILLFAAAVFAVISYTFLKPIPEAPDESSSQRVTQQDASSSLSKRSETPRDRAKQTSSPRAASQASVQVDSIDFQESSEGSSEDEILRPAPADQVLDDPRDSGGIIIPRSNAGIYTPGLKAGLSVTSHGKSGDLTPNQEGVFPMMVIVPNGTAQLALSYPELEEGTEVKLYCPDGGTIDGEAKATRTLASGGRVSFEWAGNDNLGRHSVHCIVGPQADEKVISFWVGPRAYADASAVPRS